MRPRTYTFDFCLSAAISLGPPTSRGTTVPISQRKRPRPGGKRLVPVHPLSSPWGPSKAPPAPASLPLVPKLWRPLCDARRDSLNPSFPVARQQTGGVRDDRGSGSYAPSQAHLLPPGGRLLLLRLLLGISTPRPRPSDPRPGMIPAAHPRGGGAGEACPETGGGALPSGP